MEIRFLARAWLLPLLFAPLIGCEGCAAMRATAVKYFSPEYEVTGEPSNLTAVFEGADATRRRIAIALTTVGEGFAQPTDIAFVPGRDDLMIVLEKTGALRWLLLTDGAYGTSLRLPVVTDSELGLLGIVFHPKFAENGKFYLNYTVDEGGKIFSHVAEFTVPLAMPFEQAHPAQSRIIQRIEQPYANHNGGQLQFGPDGYLYVGWGDGGWMHDPHGNGQNRKALLGKMLRLDVDHPLDGKEYSISSDNPFVTDAETLPEIWALGLRNPWRYSFTPDGRLIVADVGQDNFEEVSIVPRGGNMGWNVREAAHCFEPKEGCRTEGLTEPIYEYGREEGQSVTGGYVYTGTRVPELKGKYVFADFVQGRIWALDLPAPDAPTKFIPSADAYALGKWPMLISTFGRDAAGELYLAEFGSGQIFRLDPAAK